MRASSPAHPPNPTDPVSPHRGRGALGLGAAFGAQLGIHLRGQTRLEAENRGRKTEVPAFQIWEEKDVVVVQHSDLLFAVRRTNRTQHKANTKKRQEKLIHPNNSFQLSAIFSVRPVSISRNHRVRCNASSFAQLIVWGRLDPKW